MKALLVLAALALLGTSACSRREGLVVDRTAGTVLMAATSKPDVSMLALVGGTLTRNDRGCVALSGRDGETVALLLPYGTTLAKDGQSIAVPGTGVLRFGDRAEHGGGVATLDGLTDIPAECSGGTKLFVWD